MSYVSNGEAFDKLVNFKADYFVDLTYNQDGVWVEGDWLPWKYTVVFEPADTMDLDSPTFSLTERIGGTNGMLARRTWGGL